MKIHEDEILGGRPLKEVSEREIDSPIGKIEETPEETTTEKPREIIRDRLGRIVVPIPQDTNKNGKAGRPTDYRPEYADMLLDFMSRTSHEVGINKTYYKAGDGSRDGGVKSEKHVVIAETYPTLQRFAFGIKVTVQTLYNWADEKYPQDYPGLDDDGQPLAGKHKHPEFFDALVLGKQIQEAILVENGLSGNYSPHFAEFIATNNFNYAKKSQVDFTDKTEPRKTALDKFTSLISGKNDQDEGSGI